MASRVTSVIDHAPVREVRFSAIGASVVGSLGVESNAVLVQDVDVIQSEAFLSAARAEAQAFPVELRDALDEFVLHSDPSGALLVRCVPTGSLPATPATPIERNNKDRVSELSLLGIASLLGEPVGYLPELGGRIVQNLLPVKANSTRQTSTSSDVTLMWHTETAFHPHKPRYLVLLCLRGDANAQTLLCSIDTILRSLDPQTVEVLRQKRFRIAPDESFLGEGSLGELGPPVAVLQGDGDDLEFTFDADLMVGTDDEAIVALQKVSERIESDHIGVVLEAGDMLIVDNHRAVHGRSKFSARFDGTDRWLQRSFVVSSLDQTAQHRNGRIITTQF
jgi:L-asparagine oxygenase